MLCESVQFAFPADLIYAHQLLRDNASNLSYDLCLLGIKGSVVITPDDCDPIPFSSGDAFMVEIGFNGT